MTFYVTSSPPCWWTKTKDLSLASFVSPPDLEVVNFSIVIGASRVWLKTSHRTQAPQAQCEHGRQKYKDLCGNPDKKLKKIIK